MVLPPPQAGGGPPGGAPGGPPGGGPSPLDLFQMLPSSLFTQLGLSLLPTTYADPTAPQQPPTDGEILDLADKLKAYWSARDDRMAEDDDLYHMTTATSPGLVVRNTPQIVVNKAASMVGGQKPVFSVVAPSPDLSKQAQLVKDGVMTLWNQWERTWRLAGNGDLKYSMAFWGALRGWLTCRVSNDPYAKTGDAPVHLDLIDPVSVYPELSSRGVEKVIYRQYLTTPMIRSEWPDAVDQLASYQDDEQLEIIAYYDSVYHAVYLESAPLKPPTPHNYGFVPWFIGVAGGSPAIGDVRGGQGTDYTANVGPSIFNPIKPAYAQLNTLLSQLADAAATAANPPIAVYYTKGTSEPTQVSLDPGATNYFILNDEKAEIINTNPLPGNVAPLLQALTEDIELGSLPKVLWGGGDANQSGMALSLMSGAARDALAPLIALMESAMEEITRMALQLIRDFGSGGVGVLVRDGQGNWVMSDSMTPQDIGAVGTQVRVKYRDVSPKDQFQQAQMAMALTKDNLLSLRTAREEYLNVENPERENSQVIDEQVYKDPTVMRALVPKTLYMNDRDLFQVWWTVQSVLGNPPEQGQGQEPGQTPPGGQPAALPSGSPPLPGTPPTSLPAGMAPQQLMNLLQQARGAQAGGAGQQRPPGIAGAGGQIPGGNQVRGG